MVHDLEIVVHLTNQALKCITLALSQTSTKFITLVCTGTSIIWMPSGPCQIVLAIEVSLGSVSNSIVLLRDNPDYGGHFQQSISAVPAAGVNYLSSDNRYNQTQFIREFGRTYLVFGRQSTFSDGAHFWH